MFKEILKISPRLERGDLNKMERDLNGRFKRVAKRFGSGLMNAIKGGGIAGLALGVIGKLLNPLKEVEESINNILSRSGNLKTMADQFNTTSGSLFKLQTLAKSKGLDEDSLNNMMIRFQSSVAEAEADPEKKSAVRAWVGETDVAGAFFSFIQSLQKADKNTQLLAQQEVFGQKAIGRMSSFLNTDFSEQIKDLGLGSSDKYTPVIDRVDKLSNLDENLAARRDADQLFKGGPKITEDIIRARDLRAREEQDRNLARINQFVNLQNMARASDKIIELLENQVLGIMKTLSPIIQQLPGWLDQLISFQKTLMQKVDELVKALKGSRIIRGIFGGGD